MGYRAEGRQHSQRLAHVSRILALGLLMGASVGATATSAQQSQTPAFRTETDEFAGSVDVRVRNNNWLDMKVYALRDGKRYRLKTITSLGTAVVQIPSRLRPQLDGVQLLAVPIGARGKHSSPVVHVTRGDRLLWTLENDLDFSSLVILPPRAGSPLPPS